MSSPNEEVAQCNSQLPAVYQLNLSARELIFLGEVVGLFHAVQALDLDAAFAMNTEVNAMIESEDMLNRVLAKLSQLIEATPDSLD